MDLGRICGRAVRAEHGLHLIPHLVRDDRLVHPRVGDSLVADAALVVPGSSASDALTTSRWAGMVAAATLLS